MLFAGWPMSLLHPQLQIIVPELVLVRHMTLQQKNPARRPATSNPKPCASCVINFSKVGGDVHITVEQNSDADERAKEAYNSAHRQCLLHMAARAPKTFDCESYGRLSAPRTEVVLQRSVVEKLPLLLDIANSTISGSNESANAELELPCSV